MSLADWSANSVARQATLVAVDESALDVAKAHANSQRAGDGRHLDAASLLFVAVAFSGAMMWAGVASRHQTACHHPARDAESGRRDLSASVSFAAARTGSRARGRHADLQAA